MAGIILKNSVAPQGAEKMVIQTSKTGGKLKLFPGTNQIVLFSLDPGDGNSNTFKSTDSGDTYMTLDSEFPILYQYNNHVSFNNRYYYIGDPSSLGGTYYIWQSNNFGGTWTQDASSTGTNRFSVVKGSRDGKYILATSGGWTIEGDVLLSQDFGQTWSKPLTKDEWHECFVDQEGQNMIAGGYHVTTRYSSNYGSSWSNFSETLTLFKGAMVSGDGNLKVVWEQYESAGGLGSRLYVSTDWINWTQHNLTVRLSRGAISNDGKYILVASSDAYKSPEPYVNLSSDYGSTWSKINLTGGIQKYWSDAAMSADGKYMIVIPGLKSETSGEVYKSVDYGQTWEQETSIPSGIYYQVRISKSGRYVYIVGKDEGIFHSKDYMATWTQQFDGSTGLGVFINF